MLNTKPRPPGSLQWDEVHGGPGSAEAIRFTHDPMAGEGPDAPGSGLASDPPCEGDVRRVEGQGRSCPVRGGWKVFFADGTWMVTHGPDPPFPEPPGAQWVARDPICVGDPAVDFHNHAIYAVPQDKTDRYSTVLSTIRNVIRDSDGRLREEGEELSAFIDYRFRCTGGLIAVADEQLPINSGSDSYDAIRDALVAEGYTSNIAKYWVFWDDNIPAFCGQGPVDDDDSLSYNNLNNNGGDFAIMYGESPTNCWTSTTTMHEAAHIHGAVQQTAPNNTGAHHCNDEDDVMCYADGGPRNQTMQTICTDREHFDCQHNAYFHPFPPNTNWLYNHWNLASIRNRYILKQNDCDIGNEAGDNFNGASTLVPPRTGCSGALADGDAHDWYKFNVNAGLQIQVRLRPNQQADFDLYLHRPDATFAAGSAQNGQALEAINFMADQTGYWRSDSAIWSSNGNYTYSIAAVANDCSTGVDAGSDFNGATTLAIPKTNCQAGLPSGDTLDYYKFGANSGQVIKVSEKPSPGNDFDLCLYRPDGSQAACSTLGGSVLDSITFTSNQSGDWRTVVYQWSGNGNYTMSACVAC